MLSELAAGSGVEVFYAGAEEKLRYAEALTGGDGIPPDVARFALFGPRHAVAPTMGANRNAILLQTRGSLLLSADDDTVCRLGRAQGTSTSDVLRVGSHGLPAETWFFETRAAAR